MGTSERAKRQQLRDLQRRKTKATPWHPGMPLTPEEKQLLQPLLEAAKALGRTPIHREVPESWRIKAHFRTWNLAVQAAGLPALTSADQTQARALACEQEKCEKVLSFAHAEGFCAAIIDTKDIVFNFDFRQFCAENLCGQYDVNHSCPPNCGSTSSMQRIVTSYRKALVVQSQQVLHDWNDSDTIKRAQQAHTAAMLRITDCMHHIQLRGRMCGASACNLCEACTRATGDPCRHPDRMFSCLSAYCINVQELAKSAGMCYTWGGTQLFLYGMILIGGKSKKQEI